MSRTVHGVARQAAPQVPLRRPMIDATGAMSTGWLASAVLPSGMPASTGWSMPSVKTAAVPGGSATR